ncbi:hypothetical protein ACQ5SO_07885 [Rhodovulum sp. DZ06]|uniref:hypothetical protein n=1 Tax=Rhodovulum sp. DZ06 TaxID=3425126 RepID=UPI003D34F481
MRSLTLTLALCLSAAAAAPAAAASWTYDWESTVTGVTASSFLGVSVGDTITGSFTLDDAATPSGLPTTSGAGVVYGADVFTAFSTSATGAVAVGAGSELNVGDDWLYRPTVVTAFWRDGWNLVISTTLDGVSGTISWNVADNIARNNPPDDDVVSSLDIGAAPILANASNVSVIFDFPGLESFSGAISAVAAPSDVPLPAGAALLPAALAGLAVAGRRRGA